MRQTRLHSLPLATHEISISEAGEHNWLHN